MRDIWEKYPDEVYHEWRTRRYTGAMRFPLLWMVTAFRLQRAADHLFALSEAAHSKMLERTRAEIKAKKEGTPAPAPLPNDEEVNLQTDWQQIDTAFMLSGFALENLAKGILVLKDPSIVSDQGQFRLKTHDLPDIVELCGIALNPREKELLQALTEKVLWSGRYPGPVKVFLPQRTPGGSFEEMPSIGRNDYAMVEALVERVYEKLAELMEETKSKAMKNAESDL